MKIDDFLKEEMNWTDRDLEYRPTIGYWKVTELLQKWGEKQLRIADVVGRSEQLQPKQECYKSGKLCEYNCSGLCKESC